MPVEVPKTHLGQTEIGSNIYKLGKFSMADFTDRFGRANRETRTQLARFWSDAFPTPFKVDSRTHSDRDQRRHPVEPEVHRSTDMQAKF